MSLSSLAAGLGLALANGIVVPTFDARLFLSAIELPHETFRLGGVCATGTGTVDVATYGQSATASASGFGAGIGGRVGLMLRSSPSRDAAASWWGLRADVGMDLTAYALRAPTHLPSAEGALCADVTKTRHLVAFERTPALALEWPLVLGGFVAIGRLLSERWSGVAVGLGWRPSLSYVPAFASAGELRVVPLGLELTVDIASVPAPDARRAWEPHLRLMLTFSPSADGSQPTSGTLGAGAAWY